MRGYEGQRVRLSVRLQINVNQNRKHYFFFSGRLCLLSYGVHLRTKIIENKIQFEVQKLDYPCRNLVI